MPRYFFDIFDGHQLIDDNGVDLPDLATACSELVKSTGEYLRDHPTKVWMGETWSMRLRGEGGQELGRLELKVAGSSR